MTKFYDYIRNVVVQNEIYKYIYNITQQVIFPDFPVIPITLKVIDGSSTNAKS